MHQRKISTGDSAHNCTEAPQKQRSSPTRNRSISSGDAS
jgi:hypothetical protein